ncbi:MAG: hypothetical protein EBU00_05440 [Alphaproteobacteria bacterium]|jgi:hypothetical protein|nr:hypothetical protein [Alphaproteobacteria bacterium]
MMPLGRLAATWQARNGLFEVSSPCRVEEPKALEPLQRPRGLPRRTPYGIPAPLHACDQLVARSLGPIIGWRPMLP